MAALGWLLNLGFAGGGETEQVTPDVGDAGYGRYAERQNEYRRKKEESKEEFERRITEELTAAYRRLNQSQQVQEVEKVVEKEIESARNTKAPEKRASESQQDFTIRLLEIVQIEVKVRLHVKLKELERMLAEQQALEQLRLERMRQEQDTLLIIAASL